MTIEELVEGIENGNITIKINRYEKMPNRTRLTKGVSNVVLEIDTDTYENQLKESLRVLSNFSRTDQLALAKKLKSTSDKVKEALEEQKDSTRKSLTSINEGSTRRKNPNVTLTHGVQQHPETKDIYLKGKVIEETLLVEATYKETNKREKTVIKESLRKMLPTNQKMFKLTVQELNKLSFE